MDSHHIASEIHKAIIHYPIAFFTYALLLDFFSYFFNFKLSQFAVLTIILGFIACFPAIFTGWYAITTVPETIPYVAVHQFCAYVVVAAGFFYAFLRYGSYLGEWVEPVAVYLFLGSTIIFMLVVTGYTGGRIAHALGECTPDKKIEQIKM